MLADRPTLKNTPSILAVPMAVALILIFTLAYPIRAVVFCIGVCFYFIRYSIRSGYLFAQDFHISINEKDSSSPNGNQ